MFTFLNFFEFQDDRQCWKVLMLSEAYVTAIADKDALYDAELLWPPLFLILVVGWLNVDAVK